MVMALVNEMSFIQLLCILLSRLEWEQGTLVLYLLHRNGKVKANLRICEYKWNNFLSLEVHAKKNNTPQKPSNEVLWNIMVYTRKKDK